MNMRKKITKVAKTYGERAGYLSMVNTSKSSIYLAIADFFGEDQTPPPFITYQVPNLPKGKK